MTTLPPALPLALLLHIPSSYCIATGGLPVSENSALGPTVDAWQQHEGLPPRVKGKELADVAARLGSRVEVMNV